MTDLISRLRDTPNWMRESYGSWKDCVLKYDRAPFEAADEIEKLRAALTDIAQHQDSEWPLRCQMNVRTARAALKGADMTPTQRAAAERLADDLQRFDGTERESLRDEAAALLRELAAEPVQEAEGWKMVARERGWLESSSKAEPAQEPQAEPVASIYITPSGDREFDDWKGALPVGRNVLYAAPQPQQAEPVQEPVAWIVPRAYGSGLSFTKLTKPENWNDDYGEWYCKPLYAAPQQPMRCPKDGGECGAGGYCRPEPQQRKPLSDEQVRQIVVDASTSWAFKRDGSTSMRIARAIERAHGIGEPT